MRKGEGERRRELGKVGGGEKEGRRRVKKGKEGRGRKQGMTEIFVRWQSCCDQCGSGGGGQKTHLDGGCRSCEYFYLFSSHLAIISEE